jgi:phage terminase large subunit GpA-like protein
VAAAFTTWPNLVKKMLDAEQDYIRTGSTEALKTTINTDQGEPYLPRGMDSARLAEDIQAHAVEMPEKKVPADTRALFATCDVQKNRWEVQVHGVMPGEPYNLVVVDRFAIIKSERKDEDGERLWVKPAEHPEDWNLLIPEVMDRTYPLADGSGVMKIAMTVCDSGGKAGATANAYKFYGTLVGKGKAERFMLVKGHAKPNAPRVEIAYPDSERKDRLAKARGEVPVMMLQANILKDALNGMLPVAEETSQSLTEDQPAKVSAGRIIFPAWLPDSFFEELTVEVRTPKGWENKHARRNESWDLLYYCLGVCTHRRVEHTNWASPPPWLATWEKNPFVVLTQKTSTPTNVAAAATLQSLGEALG